MFYASTSGKPSLAHRLNLFFETRFTSHFMVGVITSFLASTTQFLVNDNPEERLTSNVRN